MKTMCGNKTFLSWFRLLVCALAVVCTTAASGNPAGETESSAARHGVIQYSVINLGPGAGLAVLNKHGQVAFSNWEAGEQNNGFFDGRKVHPLGSLGGAHTAVRSVNDLGVVVGQSQDAQLKIRAFTWSARRGMRALPGPAEADANAINNRGHVVGHVQDVPLYVHANRWNPDGTLTSLGPSTARISNARAINDSGMSVGEAEVARYDSHAIVWDANGKVTDLGTFGGTQSAAQAVNAAGQVLGHYYIEGRGIGFLWSRKHGMSSIGASDGDQYVTGLNDSGEVTGNKLIAVVPTEYRYTPFIWSRQRGMRALPIVDASESRVLALNNRRQMVGYFTRPSSDPTSRRALYWNDVSSPVDLNTRLYRAPAGLVLYSATAINNDGAIVAESNAGMVLLRPGKEGTTAPVLGPITGGVGNTVMLNERIDLLTSFVDGNAAESHVATASIDDGCPQAAPSLRERRGSGDVSLRHTFCRAGSFTVKVKVTDRAGNATQVQRRLSVLESGAGG